MLSLSVVGCSKPSPRSSDAILVGNHPGIFGGKTVTDNRFDGVVAIVMLDVANREPIGICTGTLISETIILTAAHCVSGYPKQFQIGVSFEKNALTSSALSQMIMIEDAVYHDQFVNREKETYDLGLIKIRAGSVPAGVKPVKLATSEAGLRNNAKITVAGYGVNSAFRSVGSGTLRTNQLKIDKLNYSSFEFSVDQFANGVCSGDSGGPAYIKNGSGELVQVGVVSRGFDLLVVKCLISTYFTRVDKFQGWIAEQSKVLNRFEFEQ